MTACSGTESKPFAREKMFLKICCASNSAVLSSAISVPSFYAHRTPPNRCSLNVPWLFKSFMLPPMVFPLSEMAPSAFFVFNCLGTSHGQFMILILKQFKHTSMVVTRSQIQLSIYQDVPHLTRVSSPPATQFSSLYSPCPCH